MQVVRRELVLARHVHLFRGRHKRVDKLELHRLYIARQHRSLRKVCVAYHVGHRFELDAAGHAARRAGLLDLVLVSFFEIPDRVVWVTEDPEVVATDVVQLLQIRLVYAGYMQLLDERVRRDRYPRIFGRRRSGYQQQGAHEGKSCSMRCGKRYKRAGSWSDFPGHGHRAAVCTCGAIELRRDAARGWERRRRVQFEEKEQELDDELLCANFTRTLVRVKKTNERLEGSRAAAAEGDAANGGRRQRFDAPEEFVEDLIVVLLFSPFDREDLLQASEQGAVATLPDEIFCPAAAVSSEAGADRSDRSVIAYTPCRLVTQHESQLLDHLNVELQGRGRLQKVVVPLWRQCGLLVLLALFLHRLLLVWLGHARSIDGFASTCALG